MADSPIPAGATEMPADLVCRDVRGGWGCFRKMQGGTFTLGAQATDPGAPGYDPHATPEEGPVHRVDLSPFWIQAYPTSASEYARCVKAEGCSVDDILTEGPFATWGRPNDGAFPIVGITWGGAQRYCGWLGGRLPTEAEWEASARGPEGRRFAWGNEPVCPTEADEGGADGGAITADAAVMEGCATLIGGVGKQLTQSELFAAARLIAAMPAQDAVATCKTIVELPYADRAQALRDRVISKGSLTERVIPCVVGELRGSGDLRAGTPDGLYGMGAHVWEWVGDGYGPYSAGTQRDPTGPTGTAERVQRGASWLSPDPWAWRAAVRVPMSPDAKLPDVGFRCVWTGDRS